MRKKFILLTMLSTLAFVISSCSGLKIEKPTAAAMKDNFKLGNIEKSYSATDPIALIVASYDFIRQAHQPYFLSASHRLDRVFLDYHQGSSAVKFDEKLSQLVALCLIDSGLNILDLKKDSRFEPFVKNNKPSIMEVLDWTEKHTTVKSVFVYYYSYGEKGDAKITGVDRETFQFQGPVPNSSVYSPAAYQISFYAFFDTMIDKEVAFTFQASTFDVKSRKNIIDYNHPVFVHPDTAVQSIYQIAPESGKKTTLLALLRKYYAITNE